MRAKIVILGLSLCLFGISGAGFADDSEGQYQEVKKEESPVFAIESVSPATEENVQDFGICPVMVGPASGEFSTVYNGKIYYFCCSGCLELFNENPEKYISGEESTN